VTRTFDAPRERVWRAWSDPDQVMAWWGPQGFTSPTCRMDFREGGTTLVCMRSEQGWELYNTWTYRSIEPMDRIEFVQGFADTAGNSVTPTKLGLPPGIPDEVPHVVTFSAVDDAASELTVHEFGIPSSRSWGCRRLGWSNASTRWRRASRRGNTRSPGLGVRNKVVQTTEEEANIRRDEGR
jgi:uncharacterized protein YndB with AHSA1/START domain